MSRLYDTVEPSVIDDAMLKKAIEEQGPQEEAGIIARREGIAYNEVINLRLDFRSKCFTTVNILKLIAIFFSIFLYKKKDILRIENLWQFENLTKLQLDNNVIEKIEGLENLKNLIWLGNYTVSPNKTKTYLIG
jgi:hypothetical protein